MHRTLDDFLTASREPAPKPVPPPSGPFNIIYYTVMSGQRHFEIREVTHGTKLVTPLLATPDMLAQYLTFTLYGLNPNAATPELRERYDRWYRTAQKAMEHPGSETYIVPASNEPAPTAPPRPEWKQIAPTIWQRTTPGYVLDVQLYDGKYYASVTDTSGIAGKRYMDNTPCSTLEQAMGAANKLMIKKNGEETAARMKTEMQNVYNAPVTSAAPAGPEDQSIVAFRKLLHYNLTIMPDGSQALVAKLGKNVAFINTNRGMRSHVDVSVNGKVRALGNYNLSNWALYEAPYYWYQKNKNLVQF